MGKIQKSPAWPGGLRLCQWQGEGRAVCTGEGTVTVVSRFHAFPAHVVFLSKVTRQKRQHTLGGVKARPHLPGSGSRPLKLGGPGFI